MNYDQKKIVEAAMTMLAKVPHYSGSLVVLFTNDFRTAAMHQHAVSDDLADSALEGLVRQRVLSRTPIVVPSGRF